MPLAMSTPSRPEPDKKRLAFLQAWRFGLVGLANTAIDFGTFSVLGLLAVPLIPSNVVSTSLGMAFSFFANRRFVFAASGAWKRQAVLFFLGTAFSMYVVQNLSMLALLRYAPAPLDAAAGLARWLGLRSETARTLVRSNTAKLAATVISLTWNYCFYRWAVFTPTPSTPDEV